MRTLVDSYLEFIDSGNPAKMRTALARLTEPERKCIAGDLLGRLKSIWRGYFSSKDSYAAKPRLHAAAMGVLGSGTCAQILSQWSAISWLDSEDFSQVLIDRNPPWIQELIEEAFNKEISDKLRRSTRLLMKAGLCERPQAAGYYLANFGWLIGGPVVERLSQQPDILDHDLWKFFEIEGKGEHSLAAHDKYLGARGNNSWLENIVAASAAGKIDRQRLLKASLAALGKDFTPYHAQWFIHLHEALKPDALERTSLLGQYLQLANSPAERTVSFALEALRKIPQLLHPSDKVLLIPRLLRSGTKAHAQVALLWFGELDPKHGNSLIPAIIRALSHKHRQVQVLALEALSSQEPQTLIAHLSELRKAVPQVGVNLKSKLEALVNNISPERASNDAPQKSLRSRIEPQDHKITPVDPLAVDWCKLSQPAPRIDSLNDLVYACSELLGGDVADTDLFLQVLDGFARFPRTVQADFENVTSPLLRLERKPSADYSEIQCGFTDLLRCWRTGEIPLQPFQWAREENRFILEDLYYWWCREVQTHLLSVRSQSLFSTPTHCGGWIEPTELVRRAEQQEHNPAAFPIDTALGLLRLAPRDREPALAAARELKGELGSALRYALGSDAETPGANAQLWVAASRARNPFVTDSLIGARFPGLGADATEPAQYELRVEHERREYMGKEYHWSHALIEVTPKTTTSPLLPVIIHDKVATNLEADKPAAYRRGRFIGGIAMVRWLSFLWPLNPEPFLARGLPQVAGNMKDGYVAPWNKHFLEPLHSAHRNISSEHSKFLILTALSSKDAGDASMATDILIAAIQDHRVQATEFGSILHRGLFEQLMLSSRLAPRLREVAATSTQHAEFVVLVLGSMLKLEFKEPPHLLAALLEVYRDLLIAHGYGAPLDTVSTLKRVTWSGKARGVVRDILELSVG